MESEFLATATALLAASIRMSTPLTLAGIGETYSEKSGILNIGLEGIMLSGAFFSFITAHYTQSLLLGVAGGCLGGIFIAMIHGYLSIRMGIDQTISGLALNFLSLGLTSFFFLMAFGKTTELPECPVVAPLPIPFLKEIPVIGPALFSQDLFVYGMLIVVIVSYVVLHKMEWGVNILAIGEHPKAAAAAGIDVPKTRYFAALLNGLCGGLAGSYLPLALLGFFMENITSGKGYIALVACFWPPFWWVRPRHCSSACKPWAPASLRRCSTCFPTSSPCWCCSFRSVKTAPRQPLGNRITRAKTLVFQGVSDEIAKGFGAMTKGSGDPQAI